MRRRTDVCPLPIMSPSWTKTNGRSGLSSSRNGADARHVMLDHSRDSLTLLAPLSEHPSAEVPEILRVGGSVGSRTQVNGEETVVLVVEYAGETRAVGLIPGVRLRQTIAVLNEFPHATSSARTSRCGSGCAGSRG
jgi:hypothetical protein